MWTIEKNTRPTKDVPWIRCDFNSVGDDGCWVLYEAQLKAANPSEGMPVIIYTEDDPDFKEIFGCEAIMELKKYWRGEMWVARLIPDTWFRVKGEPSDIPPGWFLSRHLPDL